MHRLKQFISMEIAYKLKMSELVINGYKLLLGTFWFIF